MGKKKQNDLQQFSETDIVSTLPTFLASSSPTRCQTPIFNSFIPIQFTKWVRNKMTYNNPPELTLFQPFQHFQQALHQHAKKTTTMVAASLFSDDNPFQRKPTPFSDLTNPLRTLTTVTTP